MLDTLSLLEEKVEQDRIKIRPANLLQSASELSSNETFETDEKERMERQAKTVTILNKKLETMSQKNVSTPFLFILINDNYLVIRVLFLSSQFFINWFYCMSLLYSYSYISTN